MVCRFNPSTFVRRIREVGGLHLESVPRAPVLSIPNLPELVPLIGHKYGRMAQLREPVVAISLYDLFHMGTGKPLVSTPEELWARFRISPSTTVVVTGVGRDPQIEAWWEFGDRGPLMDTLHRTGVALVTAPNYSVLTNVPRPDNLYNIKRILLAWSELTRAGVPTALHPNARTELDYARWSAFIRQRREVRALSFEFSTGCGYVGRIDWHVRQLCSLAMPLAVH
jgi:hypothetical protein